MQTGIPVAAAIVAAAAVGTAGMAVTGESRWHDKQI